MYSKEMHDTESKTEILDDFQLIRTRKMEWRRKSEERSNWVMCDLCIMALSEASARGCSLVIGCSYVVMGNCVYVCVI